MTRYFRKRPSTIRAEKAQSLIKWAQNDWSQLPQWFRASYDSGDIVICPREISIATPEGTMTADVNDWVICGINGEIYPCKPDIFDKTYDEVDPT